MSSGRGPEWKRHLSAMRVKSGAARRQATMTLRKARAERCPLPDFLVLGAAKAGTTSLHEYLCQHPSVNPPTKKEIHYFDHSYSRGLRWYRVHFPAPSSPNEITGEATPYYLFHPRVPELVARDLPECKLIAVLRNPIERAISHHNHECSAGAESLPLEAALDKEGERLEGEEKRMLREPEYHSDSHQHHSYVARGLYADQLERWFRWFDRGQVLVIGSERLFEEPEATMARVQAFLAVEVVAPSDVQPRNARRYASVSSRTRERLRETFAPHNERLYQLLDEDFGWD